MPPARGSARTFQWRAPQRYGCGRRAGAPHQHRHRRVRKCPPGWTGAGHAAPLGAAGAAGRRAFPGALLRCACSAACAERAADVPGGGLAGTSPSSCSSWLRLTRWTASAGSWSWIACGQRSYPATQGLSSARTVGWAVAGVPPERGARPGRPDPERKPDNTSGTGPERGRQRRAPLPGAGAPGSVCSARPGDRRLRGRPRPVQRSQDIILGKLYGTTGWLLASGAVASAVGRSSRR